MRKLNIGAGPVWSMSGWEILDNAPGNYKNKDWMHKGKCWDSCLPSDSFDLIFTSHMLEHIPQFRIERTLAEFNRIMKTGARLRILTPDLRQAAQAYMDNDMEFFKRTMHHFDDHLGIGSAFIRTVISPGGQTVALSREMDEVLGGYAHLYAYDFHMLKILLEKWGFCDIIESKPGGSIVEEMKDTQHLICEGKRYEMDSEFVVKKNYLNYNNWYISGFDKTRSGQLVVEAVKQVDVKYRWELEFDANKQNNFNNPESRAKMVLIRFNMLFFDALYGLARFLKNKVKSLN